MELNLLPDKKLPTQCSPGVNVLKYFTFIKARLQDFNHNCNRIGQFGNTF
jgi:hypothetical protein